MRVMRLCCTLFFVALYVLQLKELLAPYGQLKSLSVAMDAATGKNKVRTAFLLCLQHFDSPRASGRVGFETGSCSRRVVFEPTRC